MSEDSSDKNVVQFKLHKACSYFISIDNCALSFVKLSPLPTFSADVYSESC